MKRTSSSVHVTYDPDESLVINFLNTARENDDPLSDYARLIRWARLAGINRRRLPKPSMRERVELLQELCGLREAAIAVVLCRLRRRKPARADIDQINTMKERHRDPLDYNGSAMSCDVKEAQDIAPAIALQIACFLAEDDLTRLKRCRGCEDFFYDRSHRQNRVWCSMKTCGNRAKAEQFRRRTNGTKAVSRRR